MLKIFDLAQLAIRKVKNVTEINIVLDANILDLSIVDATKYIRNKFIEFDDKVQSAKFIYWSVQVDGKCDKEDIEDLYSIIESVITDLYCTDIKIEENADRLGLYGVPNVNMRTINLLRWIKCQSVANGFAFEVSKIGSSWKKRMVK